MRYRNQFLKYNLQFFADKKNHKKDAKGGGQDEDDPNEDDPDEDDPDEDDPDEDDPDKKKKKKSPKSFTKEEVEAIVEERLIRDRKKAKKKADAEKQAKEDDKKSTEDKTEDKYSKLEAQLESMTNKMTCLERGVNKEDVKDVVILAKSYVDEDTDFSEALEIVIKKYPHFASKSSDEDDDDEGDNETTTKKKKQDYTPKKGTKTKPKNPWKKENFNLTEQGKLIRENPSLAKEYALAAGITLNI